MFEQRQGQGITQDARFAAYENNDLASANIPSWNKVGRYLFAHSLQQNAILICFALYSVTLNSSPHCKQVLFKPTLRAA